MQLQEDARLMPDMEARQGVKEATRGTGVDIGSLDSAAVVFRLLKGMEQNHLGPIALLSPVLDRKRLRGIHVPGSHCMSKSSDI